MDVDAIHRMSTDELARLLEGGHPIDAAALDDTEYRGTSLGMPGWLERLTWSKFRKTFHRDPKTGALRGWNVRLEQNGREAPDVPLRKGGAPFTFGHFVVVSASGYRAPRRRGRAVQFQHGLMLDYGLGKNLLGPLRALRDPIVALRPGDPTLLLGWSYLELGRALVPTPSFFTLEHAGPLTHYA